MHEGLSNLMFTVMLIFVMGLMVLPSGASEKILTEYTISDFSNDSAWRVTGPRGATGDSHFENGVFTCDFSDNPGYIVLGDANLGFIVGNPKEVSLTFRPDGSGNELLLRMQDWTWQSFQRPIAVMDTDEEQTVTVSLTDMGDWLHFGTPSDGIVRPPVKVVELVVAGEGAPASVKLISLKVRTEVSIEEGLVIRPVSQTVESEHEVIKVELMNLLPWDLDTWYSWRITDLFGNVIDNGTEMVRLNSDQNIKRTISVKREGVKLCDFELMSDVPVSDEHVDHPKPLKERSDSRMSIGAETVRVVKTASAGIAKSDLPVRSADLIPDSPFGMGIYLGQRYPATDMHIPGSMARDIGIKWSREEFNWSRLEPVKGEWNWDNHDAAVQTCIDHGINVLGLLCYWTSWTQPYTEEGLRDYTNYVRTVVNRYKHHVKHWEIWNEPNIFFWGGTVEQYAELLKAAYDTIKEVDPEAKVAGCSTSHTDFEFIEQVLELGCHDKMDILTIHPYRSPAAPEESDYIGELKQVDALLREYGGPKDVWVTEIGWPTHSQRGGSGEAWQAAIIARTYILGIVSGVVQRTFWYNYRNDGMNPTYHEHNFGIVRRDETPKPAYVAFGTMTSCLEGKTFVREVDAGEGTYAYLFEGDGEYTLAVWQVRGAANLTLRDTPRSIDVVNLVGERTTRYISNAPINLQISEYPMFIEGVSSNIRLASGPISESGDTDPLMVSILPVNQSRFAVEIEPSHPIDSIAQVVVRIPGNADAFTADVNQTHREVYDLPDDMLLSMDIGLPVSVTVDIDNVRVARRSHVYHVTCHRHGDSSVIDGNLDDWPAEPSIRIVDESNVQEVIPDSWRNAADLSADVWLAWDESHFYLAVRVRDDVFHQTHSGSDVWKGDSVQFAIDPLLIGADGWGDIYEMGLALTPDGPQVYCWAEPGKTGGRLMTEADLQVARDREFTTYEAAIPLASLGLLEPQPGMVIGFSLMVNDDDGDGRKGWIEWSSGIGHQKQPSRYGQIIFVE